MKYKIGDKVRVRDDLIVDEDYGSQTFVDDMQKYKGKVFTIESFKSNSYRLDGKDGWFWSDEMLEPVENVSKESVSTGKLKVDDDVYHFVIKHINEDNKLLLSKDDIKENTKEFIAKVISAFELSPNIKPINGFYNVEFMENVYLMQAWGYCDYIIREDDEGCYHNKNLTREQILEAGKKEGKDYTPFMVKVEDDE